MMNTSTKWKRVSRRRPCPVCLKPDWCVYAGPDDSPNAVICPRVESGKRCGGAGFLHVLRDDGPVWTRWRRSIRTAIRMMSNGEGKPDFAKLAADFRAAVLPESLARLSVSLALSAASLRRLSVGWSSRHSAWTFPMQDADGNVVGIRLRRAGGRKLAAKGGREALFVPSGLQPGGRLLVAEGPTDTTALLDLGFQAVGRPSCSGGVRHLVELVKRLRPVEVVIMADTDEPGQRGAERLASTLAAYVPAVRIVTPPGDVKDARGWKRAGATGQDIEAAIEAAAVRRLAVRVQRRERNHAR